MAENNPSDADTEYYKQMALEIETAQLQRSRHETDPTVNAIAVGQAQNAEAVYKEEVEAGAVEVPGE